MRTVPIFVSSQVRFGTVTTSIQVRVKSYEHSTATDAVLLSHGRKKE